jgi:beta-glucosidase
MKNTAKSLTESIFVIGIARLMPILLGCVLAAAMQAAAQAPAPDSPAIEAKAQAMAAKLTLEQKIELIGGMDDMYTHAMPSIGLPRLKMSDASVGVRTWGPTTAYAGGVALAATWDPAFARKLRGPGQGRPLPQRQFSARAGSEHCTLAYRGPQL